MVSHIHLFSKWDQEYILADHVAKQQQQQYGEKMEIKSSEANPVKIEKLVKLFKSHRCALDFDRGFINATVVVKIENIENIDGEGWSGISCQNLWEFMCMCFCALCRIVYCAVQQKLWRK